ncbi:MAG TPA: hypothetical protein VFP32_03490, partial [Candidatus Saccharimonadales bacterium]|nr:hypothetical protein [Candidatus Saccharimonadales bacterium]
EKWWELPRDSLKECKLLLFNDEIIIQPDGKVYTPKISPIYSLYKAKSDPKVAQNCNMVELVGTAPTSDW